MWLVRWFFIRCNCFLMCGCMKLFIRLLLIFLVIGLVKNGMGVLGMWLKISFIIISGIREFFV